MWGSARDSRFSCAIVAAGIGLSLAIGVAGLATAADKPPVKIGLPGANKIFLGAQMVRGAQLAVKMINESGGVLGGRKLELVVYNTGFSPSDGVSVVQRLINEDGVKLITGEVSSTVVMAELPVMQASQVLFLASLPKHPAITQTGDVRVLRANTTTTMDIDAFKPALLAAAKGKKVGLITENTDAWIESRKAVRALFVDPSQVVFDDKYEVQQNDFTALVTNAKQSGADVLCIMGTTPEHYSNIIRAAGEIGYHPKIALVPGLIFPEAVTIAGAAMNGAFSADVYVPNIDNPQNHAFVAAFEKQYGKKPDKGVELGFESVWVIAKAVDKAGTADDAALIGKTIRGTVWHLPRGEIRYDDQGQAHGKYYEITVQNGQIDQWK